MAKEIFLSIITPMYNASKTIIKMLESVKNQTDKDLELIIIDDGSTDDSYEIAKKYLEENDLKYIIYKDENRGQSAARNIGVGKASGEYILFLDSDDYIENTLVEVAKKEVLRSNPEILVYDYKRVNEDYTVRENAPQEYTFFNTISPGMDVFEAYRLNKLRLWTAALIYRRDFILDNNLNFVEGAHAAEDLNFIFKSLWNSTKVKVIDKSLAYYYQRKDSLTNTPNIGKNITVVDSMDDLIEAARKKGLGLDFERMIESGFAVEHIMYQILGSLNSKNKKDVLNKIKQQQVKKYLVESNKKNSRYGNSMFMWSKLAAYSPALFIFLYLKKSGK